MRFAVVLFFSIFSLKAIACATDVQIQEGSSVAYCYMTGGTISATSGFVSYSWTGPQNSSLQSFVPMTSGQYVVEATDGIGCVSSDTIQVTIYPIQNATIVSSEGTTICPGSSGTMLSIIEPFNSFTWNTGSTQAVIQVTQGGLYTVQAVDNNGCISDASIFITEPNFTVTTTATILCTGGSATLTAQGGTTFLWSTGATTSSITVSPQFTTNYTVEISNSACSSVLEQAVNVISMPSSSVDDTVFVAQGEQIDLEGPEGYDSYTWLPQTNLLNYSTQNTIFNGSASSVYNVTSASGQGCVRTDTIVVIVLDLNTPTGFSPNSDGTNDTFIVPELEMYPGSIVIWNRWGDIIFESSKYLNDWDGTCQTSLCLGSGILPEGTYYYEITVEGVKFTGYTTLKM